MNRRQKIIVSITGIFIVLLALVGLTYGYFLTRTVGNTKDTSVVVESADLLIEYADGNGMLTSSSVLLPGNTIKFKNSAGTEYDTKTFTVTNKGEELVEGYVVILEDITVVDVTTGNTTTFDRPEDLVYKLTCKSSIEGKTCNGLPNQTELSLNTAMLVSNDIEIGEVQTYELSLEYLDPGIDQSSDMNKSLSMKVNIANANINPYVNNKESLAYHIINNAILNKNGTEYMRSPLTKVAEEISAVYSYKEKGTESTTNSTMSVSTDYQTQTWTYATDYKVDSSTGLFSLIDAKTCKYNETGCISDLVSESKNVYVVSKFGYDNSTSNGSMKTVTGLSNIYRITEAPAYSIEAPASITLTYKGIYNIPDNSESVLSVAQDDNGDSYYYRGTVNDNYVDFADMCWRIVRIEGDGSVKLLLEDQDDSCKHSDGNWDILDESEHNNTGNFGYTYYSQGRLISSGGVRNSTEKYILDYLHGKTDSSSSMASAFKAFQDKNILKYETKIKSGNWCYNDTAYKNSSVDLSTAIPLTAIEKIDYAVLEMDFYYDSFIRLYGNQNSYGYSPTLKCNGTILNDFEDDEKNPTLMYVGALTADEIAYAGGKIGSDNSNYYLINNYQKLEYLYFWTLSPKYFGQYNDSITIINAEGKMYADGSNWSNFYSFRPVISLNDGIKIVDGVGTKEKPYVIES